MKIKALSIQQPWAWAIFKAGNPVENRDWNTSVRGLIAIHAGKKYDQDGHEWIEREFGIKIPPNLPRGGIVGTVDFVKIVQHHPSRWFFGPFGFVFENPTECPLIPYCGQLGFFEVELS
jgi:hypothetical protein